LEGRRALQVILPSKKKHGREEARLPRPARREGRGEEGGREGGKEGGMEANELVKAPSHSTRLLASMQWQGTKRYSYSRMPSDTHSSGRRKGVRKGRTP
jgi:hypothetical protein